jgi:hypothetical protein
MEHFVTLFDSQFTPQGLSLHMSMEKYVGEYTLWVLCMDDEVEIILKKLNLPNVKLLLLSNLETPELKKIKSSRTKAEYCWTLTPFAPRFVFEADCKVLRITYIDADIFFLKNPYPIFKEFNESGKQVLITEHAYAPEYDQSITSGKFCVQFITFNRFGGELVRKWWEDRCIEWCFAYFEDGKFGDQKYLDNWPIKFGSIVHVLKHGSWCLAPWNATRFEYSEGIFYHFHGLRVLENNKIYYGHGYYIPNLFKINIYKIYTKAIKYAINLLIENQFKVTPQIKKQKIYFKILKYFVTLFITKR